jgi:two-component system, response regulator FlrC
MRTYVGEAEAVTDISVLVVEDDCALREAVVETLASAGFAVSSASSAEQAQQLLHTQTPDLVLSDWNLDKMSGHDLLRHIRKVHNNLPVVLMTAYGNVGNAVKAMQDGATDYLQKPFSPEVLVDTVRQYARAQVQLAGSGPVAVDPRSVELLTLARRVAESEATVLLTGPSGVGKEVLARYVHDHSARADGPFVAINCAAIPENMLEATLFGYEKGAFTGAHQATPGKFEQAQGGTLLLDEISEMDLNLQAKLLRVLQEREVERIGGRKPITLNVRVVATSNRNMLDEVKAHRFREDLYFRLNVFPLRCLALTERPGDIVPIAEHLIARHCRGGQRVPPKLSIDAMTALTGHYWPGNVRELDNAVQRALILQNGRELRAMDFQLQAVAGDAMIETAGDEQVPDNRLSDTVRRIEFERILQTLRDSDNTREGVAKQLGISPRTLRYKLARMREMGYAVPSV